MEVKTRASIDPESSQPDKYWILRPRVQGSPRNEVVGVLNLDNDSIYDLKWDYNATNKIRQIDWVHNKLSEAG